MVVFEDSRSVGGRISRAALSKASPIATSVVVARMEWSVREDEFTSRVCPPDARMERNGNSGVMVWFGEESESAETRRGVKRCACIWCTPTKGICHATERPFAVSRPTKRLARIPGPRVTDIKSGFWRLLPSCSVTTFLLSFSESTADGRCVNALLTSFARFS